MVLCNLHSLLSPTAFSERMTGILQFCCKRQHASPWLTGIGLEFPFFPGWAGRLYLWLFIYAIQTLSWGRRDLRRDFPAQGECPDGMACGTKRGHGPLALCFTDLCLLFCCSRRKKIAAVLFFLKRNLLFSPRSKHQNDLLLFLPPCWIMEFFLT